MVGVWLVRWLLCGWCDGCCVASAMVAVWLTVHLPHWSLWRHTADAEMDLPSPGGS